MAGHSFFGKQKLCYTEVSDFTDYQGSVTTPCTRDTTVFLVLSKGLYL